MSLGQTMISAAFFVLLTLAVLSANKMILENTKYYLQEEAIEQASNFANALLSEILTKKFDSRVTLDGSGNVSGPYNQSNLPWPATPTLFRHNMGPTFTARNNVMPGGTPDAAPYKSIRGDGPNFFDDVGDYNGYVRTANSADISGYTLTVKVYYVSKNYPDSPSGVQTFYKRIDVTVTHLIYLTNAVTFSAIATY
jgi:hypothetical protein